MMKKSLLFAAIVFMAVSGFSQSSDSAKSAVYHEQVWGIGAGFRSATIPFNTKEASSVFSFVPMVFYHGEYFFFDGIEGGLKIYGKNGWGFSAIGRLHFFDIPKEYQNAVQGDIVDWGIRLRYSFIEYQYFDAEFMSDWYGNTHANIKIGARWDVYPFRFTGYGVLKIKSGNYNSRYYGLEPVTGIRVDGGSQFEFGFRGSYHVTSNFYLFGAVNFTFLEADLKEITYNNEKLIRNDIITEAYLGFGFSNDRSIPMSMRLKNKAYIRVAHGLATPSDLSKVIRFKAESDPYNNQMTSIFYGKPLSDHFLGLPIEPYITAGFVWHWPSEVQDASQELVLAVKLYYNIPLPVRIRLGAAEGFSYITEVTYIESYDYEETDYKPSNLLNFLDFSAGLSLGDIFGKSMEPWWVGYSIHHRSGIFEMAQQFGRIKGGSNYQTGYLEYQF